MSPILNPNPASAQPHRALKATEIVASLAQLEGWSLRGDGAELAIAKRYAFPDFQQALVFANAVAWLAQQRNHHPELEVGWGHCTVHWRSHDAGGITRADFECAAAVDALREQA
jgi:4a-hydroxytetrahydrobiopterin dehydratase